jgi:hypothetical protein
MYQILRQKPGQMPKAGAILPLVKLLEDAMRGRLGILSHKT